MNLSGNIVTKDPKIVCKALGAIKSTLWKSESFCHITNQCLATAGIEGGASERAFKATLSYIHMIFTISTSPSQQSPQWMLMGKPITDVPELHQEFPRAIWGTTFFVGMHKLKVQKIWLDCIWCKSDCHPAHCCPYPASDDWLGPKP
jgi:hypothetical protein